MNDFSLVIIVVFGYDVSDLNQNTGDNRMSKKIFFLFALMLFSFSAAAAESELSVVRVIPQGKGIKNADKIVFEFNQPVVPLGEMERTADQIPIKIKPALNCQWRWLNQSSLACILGEKDRMKPATAYRITVKPELKALSGAVMREKQKYEIETVRPEINSPRSRFVQFVAPERPQWELFFSADTKLKSVKSNVFFMAGGKSVKAEVSEVECYSYSTNCRARFLVSPAKDLGVDQSYEIVYTPGFEALDGGKLKSEKEGIAAKGKTLPVFAVKEMQCHDENYRFKTYTAEETRLNPPVCVFDSALRIRLTDRTVQGNISDFVKGEPAISVDNRETTSDLIFFSAPKADQLYTVTVSDQMKDVWGSELVRPETFMFKSSNRSPSLNMPYYSIVLEAGEQTKAVGYATNLSKAEVNFKGLTAKENISGTYQIADIQPSVRNISYPFDYGIRDMLKGKTGFIYGNVISDPKLSGDYSFSASVSKWQVLAKIGWYDSLVWVTDLKTGKPVKNAKVELFATPESIPQKDKTLVSGTTDASGRAVLAGYNQFDPKVEKINQWNSKKDALFVSVSVGNDIAAFPLNGSFSISADSLSDWDISTVYYPSGNTYLRAFGFTAQGIYRPGDEVEFKIYVRSVKENALSKAPQDGYSLEIKDAAGKVVFKQKDLSLSDFGALDGKFTLPQNAVSGWYNVYLRRAKDSPFLPMQFLVSDFTPLPFSSSTEVNGKVFKTGDKVLMTSRASLFSGGAFAKAKMKQTAVLSFEPFRLEQPKDAVPFVFTGKMSEQDYEPETLFALETTSDKDGMAENKAKLEKSGKSAGKIRFETKVFDDSGRSASSFASADYFATDRFVGLRRQENTATVEKATELEYVVADTDKKLVAGVPVTIVVTRSENKLVREKSAGNAYLMKYVRQEQKVAECKGVSASEPQKCSFTPDKSGLYDATATIDGHSARMSFYVEGADYVPWASDENKLKMTPDKKSYAVGDEVVLTVENPAPGAQALITVERYGILQSFVKVLENSIEQIKLPVTEEFFPGVYVSVAVVSPRVDKPIEGTVDLGKPTQWTGYLKIPVLDKSRQITVAVKPEKQEYRPGQTMKATLKTTLPNQAKEPVEAAVVVLDEAVLSLLPHGIKSFDPYEGLNELGELNVRTYSLIRQLIGRQKIEKKGANQGGDGGSDFAVRDIFKFVGYFNPSIKLDENGEGSFEMKLPDNLTGWRIIAVAVTPEQYSGMGESRFNVSQPLEIRALLPNQLRANDIFAPAASVMNRTDKERTVSVSVQASGSMKQPVSLAKEITLKPFERQAVFFDNVQAVLTPEQASGKITLTFRAVSGQEKDGLKQTLDVLNLTTFETAALFGSADGQSALIPVSVPQGVKEYGGRFFMSAAPTVLNGLRGAVKVMRDYPHPCWEQKLSRAVAAAVYASEKNAVWPEDLWTDADEFVKKTLTEAPSYQAENGGMAYFTPRNDYVSPYLSAYTAYAFSYLARLGYEIPQQVQDKLARYLTTIFKLTEKGLDPKISLTTRLLSAGFLKERNLITVADIAVFERDIPLMSSFNKALYLQLNPENKTVLNDLYNSSYKTSGSLIFKEEANQPYGLLSSAAKTTCAALSAFTRTDPVRAEALVRGAYSLRLANGSWINTQANAFCMMAVQEYAGKAETQTPDLTLTGKFGDKTLFETTFASKTDKPVMTATVLTPETAGEKLTAGIEAQGQGKYYYSTILSYPSDLKKAVNAGLEVSRALFVERDGTFVPVNKDTVLKRGELVKVELTLVNPVGLNFVALRDCVAGAFEPVSSLLATSSKTDQEKAKTDPEFDFEDIGHKAVGFYAEVLPAGTHKATYMAQVVADGVFTAFPAKAEAMYAPDVFGLTASDTVKVAP
ncbi:MAG: hypothetical protein J5716_01790 [Alphaproteobacteria bacterium]|nr:hypothetical protein [Alphaproteobacteria bacterium]